jgi:hypothetical protein
MLKIPETLPVRTRLPLAAWAIAALVALFSLMSSLVHSPVYSNHPTPVAQQAAQPAKASHEARL